MHQKYSRARESRAAIQKLHVSMRHLFIRGNYKPLGVSGESMMESMLSLRPEIYGSIADAERVELDGLLYIFQRLPMGIEECRFINLISREGLENSQIPPIIPAKRRRNCFRLDKEQMMIEMTRGRSDIYDVLTHLTFMYVESEKIRNNAMDYKGRLKREWELLKEIIVKDQQNKPFNKERAYSYLSTLLGRTYDETAEAAEKFGSEKGVNSLFEIVYHLGRNSMNEFFDKKDREITFSSALREKVGHHIYGELWATNIKNMLVKHHLDKRPIHIVSSNPHSVMNSLYAKAAAEKEFKNMNLEDIAIELSKEKNGKLRSKVKAYALKNGMLEIDDISGTNIVVQIIDTNKINPTKLPSEIRWNPNEKEAKPVILIMDYAFGEQAFETMDELLKPIELNEDKQKMNIHSVSIMGKAGILTGGKGDIMIPDAHIFEGTADNYPFTNDFSKDQFEGRGVDVYEGSMITVLGTSLQNRDILRYFARSSWSAIGLEMEGAHYQKAIQAASRIRHNVSPDLKVRYAYYASDNPLESGQTLASGSLGISGVRPTYVITEAILNKILE